MRLFHNSIKKNGGGIFIMTLMLILCAQIEGQVNAKTTVRKTITNDKKLFINYDILADSQTIHTVKLKFTYEGKILHPNPDNLYGEFGKNITPGEKMVFWDFRNESIEDINKVQVDISLIPEIQIVTNVEISSISNDGYAPCTVSFENLSKNADTYHWNFDDPTSGSENSSIEPNPKHTYRDAGIYSVTLTARNENSGQENKFFKTVDIKAHDAPIANFQINSENPKAPVKISFINLSLNANSYYWDFNDPASGDKNISVERNPYHKYSHGGTYIVKLRVSNNRANKTDTIRQELIIQNADLPIPKFSFSKSSDFAPAVVSFENKSEFMDKYHWNFGDLSSGEMNESKEGSPVHLYERAGNYIVSLKARPKGLKRSVIFTDTVRIEDPNRPIIARFSIQNNNIYAPGTLIFRNESSNATNFSWNFGDSGSGIANTSNEINPTHTYYQPGEYKVVLVAGSENQKDKSVFSKIVRILKVPQ